MSDLQLYKLLAERTARGLPAALATVIAAHGSTPRNAGAKMIIFPDASTKGTIGGGCGEGQVIRAALEAMLGSGLPRVVTVDLTDEMGTRETDVCGGKMAVFVEPFGMR